MPSEYKNEIIIEYEDANEHTLFPAKSEYADEETDKKFEEILQSAYNSDKIKPIDNSERVKSPESIENSLTSSIEDSIKIYNVQTGEIVKCKPEDKLSKRYESDKNDNIDIPDKNAGETETVSERSDVTDDVVIIDSLNTDEQDGEKSDLDELANLPSVKELAKKFVSMESLSEPIKPPQPVLKRHRSKENILNPDYKEKTGNKLSYMHSLTARSISREFREELKLSMATPLTVPGGAKELPEGEEIMRESSRPSSPVPEPGTIKTKLAFFESLKNKFTK